MGRKSDKINRIFLWLIVAGGLLSLLIYGLSAFFGKPAMETITTRTPEVKTDNGAMRDVKYENRKSNRF